MAEDTEATDPQANSAAEGADKDEVIDTVEVSDAKLSEAPEQAITGAGGQIDVLLDTTMSVTVSMGEVQMRVKDLLQLGPGSVLKLSKQVGEPVDLLLRGIPFANGTIVVVGEQLGVRIKEILSPAEKIAAE